MINDYLDIKDEVKDALAESNPIVALESTIISHGMPYPENIVSAKRSEEIIREAGGIPATIAIINGRIKIGLTESDLDHMGKDSGITKASRRDMAMILSKGIDGATTVATTMLCADLAGIRVFATGGIGGVHRNGQTTMDVSADLQELAGTNVGVVCAGAKSILDIGLTLEYLETHGVPVIGYGTENFPAFYIRESGYKVDYRVDEPAEIARALKVKWDLGLKGGMVIANPIPVKFEMDNEYISAVIDEAVESAEREGVKGKGITPYVLARLHTKTGDKSLFANKELVYNNVRLAAQIAIEYSKQ
ncbi:MAG: pseudouridine-5'-phosphate glycosidase [Spirochaetia bacterium]|jgi:pseudouridine-5'-phosphate glycosidase|nr:pseudouridine-5'-phosphate glycosidase [Spirochaetia bacterium]